jgi:hypothetical protein
MYVFYETEDPLSIFLKLRLTQQVKLGLNRTKA